jgi:hypothetical protein
MSTPDDQTTQAFLDAIDETGDRLREVLDDSTGDDSPAIQFYLQGAAFLEAGYLLVEQLAAEHPGVFTAMKDELYMPLFERAARGQIGWGEALNGLPAFLREYAAAKVNEDLLGEDEA